MRRTRSKVYRPIHPKKLNRWVKTNRSFGNAILVAVIVLRMWITEIASESPTIKIKAMSQTKPAVTLKMKTADKANASKVAITFIIEM